MKQFEFGQKVKSDKQELREWMLKPSTGYPRILQATVTICCCAHRTTAQHEGPANSNRQITISRTPIKGIRADREVMQEIISGARLLSSATTMDQNCKSRRIRRPAVGWNKKNRRKREEEEANTRFLSKTLPKLLSFYSIPYSNS